MDTKELLHDEDKEMIAIAREELKQHEVELKNIESKISSGDLDQGKLVEEAQAMMGALNQDNPMLNNLFKQFGSGNSDDSEAGGFNMEQGLDMMQSMMKNFGGMNQNNAQARGREDSRTSSTRDRLRRKLEARKNQQ